MIVLGLTGSIGMGKSTTAKMFADAGVPVHDSDEAVHRLYSGAAAPLVEAAFPGTVKQGVVDRTELRQARRRQSASDRAGWRRSCIRWSAPMPTRSSRVTALPARRWSVLDIPLLFETGGTGRVDKIVVVTAPAEIQRERVLSRPGMTPEKFEAILARQTPDAEKRRRADFVIDTGNGLDAARQAVHSIIRELTGKAARRGSLARPLRI